MLAASTQGRLGKFHLDTLRVLTQRTLESPLVTVGFVDGLDGSEPHCDAALKASRPLIGRVGIGIGIRMWPQHIHALVTGGSAKLSVTVIARGRPVMPCYACYPP